MRKSQKAKSIRATKNPPRRVLKLGNKMRTVSTRYHTCPECEASFRATDLIDGYRLPSHKFLGKRCPGIGMTAFRKNPPLTGTGTSHLRTAGASELIGLEVYEISYRHAKDGKDYKHAIESDVILLGLPDGSLRLESTTGKRLWKVFNHR